MINLRIVGSEITTITLVLGVSMSIKATKFEFLTVILRNCAVNLLQLSLNCLIMLVEKILQKTKKKINFRLSSDIIIFFQYLPIPKQYQY